MSRNQTEITLKKDRYNYNFIVFMALIFVFLHSILKDVCKGLFFSISFCALVFSLESLKANRFGRSKLTLSNADLYSAT